MSFFDTILDLAGKLENTSKAHSQQLLPTAGQRQETAKNGKKQEKAIENEASGPRPADQAHSKAHSKPEKLSFLRPCPICRGRNFIYGSAGGFFCAVCQPGIQGQPVEATGPERQPAGPEHEGQEAEGLYSSCLRPEVERIDQEKGNFAAAWPLLKEMMPALLAAGWSRAALLRRRKHRGTRGVAWLPVWRKPALAVTVGGHGEIIFTFKSGDREIKQTAWPELSFFQRPENFQMESPGGERNPLRRRGARKDPRVPASGQSDRVD